MNKKGVIHLVVVLIIIVFIVLVFYNKTPNPPIPKPLPKISNSSDTQFEERYIRQAIIISNFFSSLSKIEKIDTKLQRLDAINRVIYAGSTMAKTLNFDNKLISSSTNLFSLAYTFRIAEYEVNNIVPLFNNIIDSSNLKPDSSSQESKIYLEKVGEFSGKTCYLIIRSEADLVAGFIKGTMSLIKKSGLTISKDNMIKYCGNNCLKMVEVTNNEIVPFVIKELIPTIDQGLYEFFGYLGKISAPILVSTTTFTEDIIKNDIEPKAKELANNFKQQIEDQIN